MTVSTASIAVAKCETVDADDINKWEMCLLRMADEDANSLQNRLNGTYKYKVRTCW